MFAIYDTMQHIPSDVSTVCMGMAASAAAVLLAAGAPGKRYALPNSRVLIHQPHGGAQGQQIDIEIQAARDQVPAAPNGGSPRRCTPASPSSASRSDTDRDFIMGAEAAMEYGMVDHVMVSQRPSLASVTPPDAIATG